MSVGGRGDAGSPRAAGSGATWNRRASASSTRLRPSPHRHRGHGGQTRAGRLGRTRSQTSRRLEWWSPTHVRCAGAKRSREIRMVPTDGTRVRHRWLPGAPGVERRTGNVMRLGAQAGASMHHPAVARPGGLGRGDPRVSARRTLSTASRRTVLTSRLPVMCRIAPASTRRSSVDRRRQQRFWRQTSMKRAHNIRRKSR